MRQQSNRLQAVRRPALARTLRATSLALAVGLLAQQTAWAQASEAAAERSADAVAVDIAAMPLNQALNTLAQQAKVQIVFASALTQGKTAPALNGRYTPQAALQRLLAGSGLTAHARDDNTFTVEAGASNGDLTLKAVTVTAVSDTTEGTGSYAVKSASTATKLPMSLRETPQSVTVVTRQRMDDMGAQTMSEVMGDVTGVVVQVTDSERVSYVSRGYSISTYQVDGVNTSYSNNYVKIVSDPAIYDRVEVLRGAAGQTLGAGDPGGTINQVRKRPTSEFSGNVGLTYGRWNNRRAEIDLGGPLALNGHIRGRTVLVRQKSDSFRDFYTSDKTVAYGILEADLGEKTMATVGYDYQKPENSGITYGSIPYWLSDGSLANMPRSFNPASKWSQWAIKQKQTFARLDHEFNDDWKARLTYTHEDQTVYGQRWFAAGTAYPNPDGTGMEEAAWYGGGNNFATARTWDIDLNGRFDLFGHSQTINVGYHNEDTKNRNPGSKDAWPSDFLEGVPDWRNWDGNVPRYIRSYYDYDNSYSIGKQSAFYAAANLRLAEPLRAVIGTRYSDWSKYTWTRNASTGLYSRSGYDISNVLTPYAGLLFDVSKNFTLYGSYTDIFQPQNNRDYEGKFLDPINGKHYEIGLKGEFFDGNLNTTVAMFRSKKDNLAEVDDTGALPVGSFDPKNPPSGYNSSGYRIIPGSDNEVAYRSTGKGNKINGYELEVQGAVSKSWNLAAGLTHVRIRDKNGVALNPYQPRNTFRLRTSYRLPGDLSKLTIGGGLTWQSKTWANATNVPTGVVGVTETRRITQHGFYLVNLSAHYDVTKQLSLSLNINNLFDKSYYTRVGFYNGVTYGTPRDYRVTMRYNF